MEISFRDIIYFKKNKEKELYDLKYNTMTNHEISLDEMDRYQLRHIGFCKDLVWYYEKETRLLAQLKGDLIRQLNPSKNYVIVWSFEKNLLTHAKFLMAPDITAETLSHKIVEYPAVRELFEKTSCVQISEYAGTVELSPCKRCARKRLDE